MKNLASGTREVGIAWGSLHGDIVSSGFPDAATTLFGRRGLLGLS